ncbi:hypothetical protein E2C01_061284 [Portunus trituberculatus]|uniref:Uncharacterized protein n=1 Tax=Portunus trituberculatus TaxID=210409 RepID=A0A5B7HDZ2_PORTR|nr:hypothetical protein [Portunus trituberculatus]
MLQKLVRKKLREVSKYFGSSLTEESDRGHFWSPPQKGTPNCTLCSCAIEYCPAAKLRYAHPHSQGSNLQYKQIRGMGLSLLGFLLPVLLMMQLLAASAPREFLRNMIGEDMAEAFVSFMVCNTLLILLFI